MNRIVITGASGFVGKALLEKLSLERGLSVLALSRSEPPDNEDSHITWAETDYSAGHLTKLLSGADAVIHLAGTKGTKTELSDYDDDMRLTSAILDAMTRTGVSRIVYSSSRLVYGNPVNIPWKETTVPEPSMAYGMNKIRCEELCKAWAEASDNAAVTVRCAQVLGEGERTRNMMNVFLESARNGEPLNVIGKSVARRQYIYDLDLAEILLLLAGRTDRGYMIVNAGMEKGYTNLEIAMAITEAFHSDAAVIYDDSKEETISSSVMDIEVLQKKIGYTPMDLLPALRDLYSR